MNIGDIQTPAVLIETETLHRNLRRLADYCKEHDLALRPHTKTHKIPEIAKLQVKYGASGITVAKLAEAEVMANAGISDINVVYPLWGDSKWRRKKKIAIPASHPVSIVYITFDATEHRLDAIGCLAKKNPVRRSGRDRRSDEKLV